MSGQFVHGRLRNPGLEEIGVQPDLNTLEFADLDDLFNLTEKELLGRHQNGIGGVRMQ